MSGAELIQVERQRQIDSENWTPEHDNEHVEAEMAYAASVYAHVAANQIEGGPTAQEPSRWPSSWGYEWYKPSSDPIRNLVKAGALIAAEIDRLQRKSGDIDEN